MRQLWYGIARRVPRTYSSVIPGKFTGERGHRVHRTELNPSPTATDSYEEPFVPGLTVPAQRQSQQVPDILAVQRGLLGENLYLATHLLALRCENAPAPRRAITTCGHHIQRGITNSAGRF